jgi:hypothetical protein
MQKIPDELIDPREISLITGTLLGTRLDNNSGLIDRLTQMVDNSLTTEYMLIQIEECLSVGIKIGIS